ncbi:pre-mRNA-splicing factor ATP-dependent RNA helicase-like [Raphidocelis subcapitata]|uniref:RNA helicase n=1 Tax=Raphidocelis subcapitata TaxID=307507 RepID=A0A2V0NZY9_9CHLO|nr:pre-mRNA-splicing factor ATP-dependent RNA helicase-like [Raphidocelis subcapitata]|eukprot:GBF90487.1 pre-mRNA-splicing factor ATP-dependent RNA helicase-like [Raphidocelis subcapitata]
MSFQRPGSISKSAFGVAFNQRRGGGAAASGAGAGAPPPAPPPPPGPAGPAAAAGQLPAARHRRQILFLLETHATLILVGETGSGKTTQVPQIIAAAGWGARGAVAVTQPRRVAAVSVAQRVAEEAGCPVGGYVGYAVRFEEACSQATRIKYLTDGVLLREMAEDPLLTRYSVVMVDEAHERSLATDTLLGLLKKARVERLAAFFDPQGGAGGAAALAARAAAAAAAWRPGAAAARVPAVLGIEGRLHPVQIHYLLEPTPDYVRAAVTAVTELHREDVPGDVLVFLTGQDEVEAAVGMLEAEAARLRGSRLKYRLLPLPLCSGLPGAQQRAALQPAARGARKVVVATNIAETSLTLEGIVYVVDSCFVKQRAYDPATGLESLLVAPTSQASAAQRAGRAGRVRPGHCFRLCTEEDFSRRLPAAGTPEMQRSDLAGLLLQLKALGVDNVLRFDWPAPPPAEAVVRGLELLHALGALDGDAKLTRAVGLPLASLPLEPPLGAALLAACARYGCADHALLLCGLLSVPSIWGHFGGGGGGRARDARAAPFAVAEGDFVTALNAHRAWAENGRSHKWANSHGLHQHGLLRAEEVAKQLRARLGRARLLPRDASEAPFELGAFLRCVAAGLFSNAARYDRTEFDPRAPDGGGTHVYRLLRDTKRDSPLRLRIHPSSVLWRVRTELVLFHRCQQNEEGWHEMQGVTAVRQELLAEVAPHYYALRR